jgi:hypothetical protein
VQLYPVYFSKFLYLNWADTLILDSTGIQYFSIHIWFRYMDTGVLGTSITFLPIKLHIYPAVWGEHVVHLVGSCPNFRLFSECPCIAYLYIHGKSRKFPKLSHPNNQTSVKSKGVDFTGIYCVLSVKKVVKN